MTRRFSMCALLGILVVIATGCAPQGTPTGVQQDTPTATNNSSPTWTPAPSPTATAIPPGSAPTPTDVPAGWQVYAAQHFSIAYPPDWIVQIQPLQGGGTAYGFQNADNTASVSVHETDGLDSQAVASFCSSHDQIVTFAGLPMHYVSSDSGHTEIWSFVSSNNTEYDLYISGQAADPTVEQQDKAVLSTFRAQYTTPGCH